MLVQLGPAAVSRLTAALWDEDPTRRALAAIALGQLGRAARAAVPPLLERLKDEDALVRGSTAETRARLGARSAIPALTERLEDDEDEYLRATASAAQKAVNTKRDSGL
jgi:HEAT repeat protein